MGVEISLVSVESLQRKYIKVRFLRDFERDCSGVGGFYYTHVTPPVSRKKRGKKKKKKKQKSLVEILTYSSEIRASTEENSKLIVLI